MRIVPQSRFFIKVVRVKSTDKDKTLQELQAYVKKQLDNEIWEEEQRFENQHKHYIDMSPDYYEMKMSMLHNIRTVCLLCNRVIRKYRNNR